MSIALGNELRTKPAHATSFSPDVSSSFPASRDRQRQGGPEGRDEEEDPAEGGARRGRGRPPALLAHVGQGRADRSGEPQEVQDREPGDDSGDQHTCAVTVVERHERVTRGADAGDAPVDEVAEDEEGRRLDPGGPPQAFEERPVGSSGGGRISCAPNGPDRGRCSHHASWACRCEMNLPPIAAASRPCRPGSDPRGSSTKADPGATPVRQGEDRPTFTGGCDAGPRGARARARSARSLLARSRAPASRRPATAQA